MAKLGRVLQKIFGLNATTGGVGVGQLSQIGSFAAGSSTTENPNDAGALAMQGLANYLTGWFACVVGSNSPVIEDMNSLHFLITRQLAYIFQEGVPEWDSTTTYYTGSIVNSAGVLYISKQDTNLNNAVTNGVFWVPINAGTGFDPQMSQALATVALNTWATQSAANSDEWNGICWSPELALFCAVASSTGSAQVQVSPDGKTWTSHTAASAADWGDVCWSPQLGLFCAVGAGGVIMTSPDGTTWTSRTSGTTNDIFHVIWVPELQLFVATTSGAISLTSPNGTTWTSRTMPSSGAWEGLAWSPQLSLIVSVVAGASASASSPDGVTWTATTLPSTEDWFGVAWSPQLRIFCAVGAAGSGFDGFVLNSGDGINWIAQTGVSGVSLTNIIWCSQLGCFVATGAISGSVSAILFSFDGKTWNTASSTPSEEFAKIAFSPKNGIFAITNIGTSGHVYISTYVKQIIF